MDYELDYATQLAVYLNAHRRFPYRVIVCSAMAELKAFLQHKEVEMLVTVPEYRSESEKLWKEQKIQKLFFFKEAKSEEENEIYRFQSAEKIRRLLQKGELQEDDVGTVTKVGIFSSTGGVEKTKFSETLASVYAKSGKTLLLSFEPYGVCENEMKGGLSELIFYMKQREEKLIVKLREFICQTKEYEYVGGVRYSDDLFEMNSADIQYFFEKLGKESLYDTIVCDIGGLGKQSLELLMVCDIVCMPIFPSQEKNQNVFMRQMKQMSKGILLERIVEINILEKQEKELEEKTVKRYWLEAMQAAEKGGQLLEGIRATKAEDL